MGEIMTGEFLVEIGQGIEQGLAPMFGGDAMFVGDFGFGDDGAEVFRLIKKRFHFDQVDQALELAHRAFGACADRDENGDGPTFESFADFVKDAVELRAHAIHFVDEAETRDVIFIGLSPDGFALGLDPFDGREDDDRAVEDSERAFDLGGEIDVAGSVDDVDRHVFPVTGDRGGDDGDPALTFLLKIIGGGRSFVDLSHAADFAGVIKDAFGRRRFSGVDVRDDADVADRL